MVTWSPITKQTFLSSGCNRQINWLDMSRMDTCRLRSLKETGPVLALNYFVQWIWQGQGKRKCYITSSHKSRWKIKKLTKRKRELPFRGLDKELIKIKTLHLTVIAAYNLTLLKLRFCQFLLETRTTLLLRAETSFCSHFLRSSCNVL